METPSKMIRVLGHQPGNVLEKRPMVANTMFLSTNEHFPLCAYVTKWLYAYTSSCNTLCPKNGKEQYNYRMSPLNCAPYCCLYHLCDPINSCDGGLCQC